MPVPFSYPGNDAVIIQAPGKPVGRGIGKNSAAHGETAGTA